MVRPKKYRYVEQDPSVTYFKPRAVPVAELEEIVLAVDELEAVRLSDLLGLSQGAAAKQMGFHQSTFNRVLSKAREKLADAIVNGKAIKIHGGVYKMPGGDGRGPAGAGFGRRGGFGRGAGMGAPANCRCPRCSKVVPHKRGIPCTQMKCPDCGSVMIRG